MSEHSLREIEKLDSEYAFTQSMPEKTAEDIKAKRDSFARIASNGHCGRTLANNCRIEDERLEKLKIR